MKCCLCGMDIEKQYDDEGNCFWDTGHNAEPLVKDGRCCGKCNDTKVIPRRIVMMQQGGS